MMHLPEEFLTRMKSLLGTEYEDFLASYERPRVSGLRVNTLKCTPEDFSRLLQENFALANRQAISHFQTESETDCTSAWVSPPEKTAPNTFSPVPVAFRPIPWIPNGFFIPDGVRMGASPLYAAGVFYLQEPSAMTPASRLPVVPGERVLDLCAAPGGKATELAARLNGQGLLVANDISTSRAKALLRNLELFGAANIFVTNETPGNLAGAFEGFFDKILVDAPCSGEGMFRKDASVIAAWTPDKPAHCAKLQRDILENAVKMLREGGMLLYSTCTFAPEEDEGMIAWLLKRFPEMHLLKPEGYGESAEENPCGLHRDGLSEAKNYAGFAPGRPDWADGNPELAKCVRIWPHRMDGEGHFLALLGKDSDGTFTASPGNISEATPQHRKKNKKKNTKSILPQTVSAISRQDRAVLEDFFKMVKTPLPLDALQQHGERVFLSPELPSGVRGLKFLRNGLYVGDLKKNRFEPSQPFAMTLCADRFSDCLNLRLGDERIEHFLSGETISVNPGETRTENGWKLVCVEGFSLGWGKLVNGILKNKYPAGWRR